MLYWEHDPRVLSVLERALRSSSRSTRLRAVAMLEHVGCPCRERWLDRASVDPEPSVAQTAACVLSWVAEPAVAPWPRREEPRFDLVSPVAHTRECSFERDRSRGSRWQWEYIVEVWRDDALPIGSFLVPTCEEDDEHAKRIALGQAIIASAGGGADAFDPGSAAAFIVGKRALAGGPLPPGRPRGGRRGEAR